MNRPDLTDVEIWTALKKGEEWAVCYIYTGNAEKLYRYGLKFTSENALVEDALQDLFTEIIKNRKNLGDTDNILFYLLKSFKRKLLRKIKAETRFCHNEEIKNYKFDITWSVEHDLVLKELSEQKSKMLFNALQDLTPRQKEAIYLRFTKELDYSSIAGIMDISVEACRNLISKAISTLKKWISENGHGSAVFFALVFK